MKGRMDSKFDEVRESLETIENKMVTKPFLDDKLSHYVRKTI
jgi:hypothetical protein